MLQLAVVPLLIALTQAQSYPYAPPVQQYQPYQPPSNDVYPYYQPSQNGPNYSTTTAPSGMSPLEGFLTAFGQLVNAYVKSTEEVAKTAPLYGNSVDDQAALYNKYIWKGLRDFLNERLPLLEKTTTVGPNGYPYSNDPNQPNMGKEKQ